MNRFNFGTGPGEAELYTPVCVTNLKPEEITGCNCETRLVWENKEQTFTAYHKASSPTVARYAGAEWFSYSCAYGGTGETIRSEADALEQCAEFLWSLHTMAGHDNAGHPNKDTYSDAISAGHASFLAAAFT